MKTHHHDNDNARNEPLTEEEIALLDRMSDETHRTGATPFMDFLCAEADRERDKHRQRRRSRR